MACCRGPAIAASELLAATISSPDSDRAAGTFHVNDSPALSDLDAPQGGQAASGGSDVAHEIPPAVRPRRAGRIRWADRSSGRPLAEQPQNHPLQFGRPIVSGSHNLIIAL
jgi:hypothetical protein